MHAKRYIRWATFLSVFFALTLLSQGLWAQEATPEVDADCAHGIGYWANHSEAWAVTTLTLGSQSYSQTELLLILSGGGDGDASLIMARQLIAAKLSAAGGVSSAVMDGLISAGDALLASFEGKLPYNVEPSSSDGQSMTALSNTLDSFNEGESDTECDDDVEETPEATVEGTPEATPEITPEATLDNDGLEITIIIEGPVESINANIIVIYGFNIEVDENDPLLVVIQVGDVVRIEGNIGPSTGTTIVIIAVVIIIVDVDVVIGDDGAVWRDHGNCDNPPPPWAPAHGWHRRCDPQSDGGSGGSGRGGGS
jgi:hypothetical protein